MVDWGLVILIVVTIICTVALIFAGKPDFGKEVLKRIEDAAEGEKPGFELDKELNPAVEYFFHPPHDRPKGRTILKIVVQKSRTDNPIEVIWFRNAIGRRQSWNLKKGEYEKVFSDFTCDYYPTTGGGISRQDQITSDMQKKINFQNAVLRNLGYDSEGQKLPKAARQIKENETKKAIAHSGSMGGTGDDAKVDEDTGSGDEDNN